MSAIKPFPKSKDKDWVFDFDELERIQMIFYKRTNEVMYEEDLDKLLQILAEEGYMRKDNE